MRAARATPAIGQYWRGQLSEQLLKTHYIVFRHAATDDGLILYNQAGSPCCSHDVLGSGLFGTAFTVWAVDDDTLVACIGHGLHIFRT